MINILRIRNLILCVCLVSIVGCAYIPKPEDFSKPVKITSLSETAWVVDIGKALDRTSRYKLSQIEAAKEAQRKGCDYFIVDSPLNKQLSPYQGQRAYRCAKENSNAVLVTEEILLLDTL